MQIQFAPRSFLICLGLLLVGAVGCLGTHEADYSKLGLIPVTGKITLDGNPLPDTVVFFVQADGTKSYSTTNANGKYRMKFNSKVDGVLPGDVVVEISTTASTGEINLKQDDGEGFEETDPDARPPKSKQELVPVQYNKKSQLKVTVSKSEREFNFDLKSDGSTTGPS